MEEFETQAERANPCWYVIQCKGGESFRAAEHLTNQGYEVFHPVLNAKRKRQGKLTLVTEPLFPYYLFIRLDQTVSNWRPIRSTRGVLRLLTFGNTPIAVPNALVDTLRAQPHHQEGSHSYFCAGEKVTITDGPFKDLEAVFKRCKGEERAIVLLNVLQRPQDVEISVDNLQKK
ncbi:MULTISPECIES: transcription/translation regulatory transformer protein RfaH [unclassified Halomonas]|uniref:transcription/translation regulatory transformer protein RfaH n=1 Tax=Halomonas sp. N3-2A TaxID=2014541 RepID=UPI000B5B30A5|nr:MULTISPECIES: transcription/translation regulatory transformer protein RfaH [unclassified Halomonas]ASK18031.1 transcription/translation regulatory transformer protein RfaH [Halomonas sp. N3-2A]UTD55504.1 transcription/translation regulatory transformer protein RfaH [Halomonas sp. MS1]